VGDRSGLGLIDVAVLEALRGRSARRGRGFRRSSTVLTALAQAAGLAQGYGYEFLVDLAQPWKTPVPLVDGQGNFGSQGNDPPASPRYTEARLSAAGQVVLAGERGEIAPVPIGLINGNTYRQGTRPPYRPQGIIDAIRRVLRKPRTAGQDVLDIVGPPDFITGCAVSGDVAGLAAGRCTEIRLEARVRITDEDHFHEVVPLARPSHVLRTEVRGAGGSVHFLSSGAGPPPRNRPRSSNRTLLLIDRFPSLVNPDEAIMSIVKRAERYDDDDRYPGLCRAARDDDQRLGQGVPGRGHRGQPGRARASHRGRQPRKDLTSATPDRRR
jgi:DNA gyrase/topoisomerase IV, subunit A